MKTDFKEIKNSALNLEEKQRAELTKRLLVSLEDQVDVDIEQAWIDEINRREEQIKSGKVRTVSAEKVLAKARNLLKK